MAHRVLTEKLTEQEMRLLGLELLTIKRLVDILSDSGEIGWLSDIGLDSEERFQLIDEFQKTGVGEYWKQLPVHELIDGKDLETIDGAQAFISKAQKPSYPYLASAALLVRPPVPETWNRLYTSLEEWGAGPALSVALTQEDCSRYFPEILDALLELQHGGKSVPDSIKIQLKNTAWLPGIGGKKYKPYDIIHLDGLEDELAQLLTGIFPVVQSIEPSVRRHPVFPWILVNLVPNRDDTLKVIGMGVSELDNYRLGRIRDCIEDPSIGVKGIVRIFKGIESRFVPILPILE